MTSYIFHYTILRESSPDLSQSQIFTEHIVIVRIKVSKDSAMTAR